jgi:quercetin dioxygenase-like cupin family protein
MRTWHLSILAAAGAGLAAGLALAQAPSAIGRPVAFADVVRSHPIDPATGGAMTPIAQGEFATVNVWQLAARIPAHFHRSHEEIVIVQSGTGEVRVGAQTHTLKAGDVLLVPKNVVHSVRATGEVPFRGVSVFGPAFDGQDRVFVEERP